MKSDHRIPLQEFGYAVLPSWQPTPKLSGLARVAIIFGGVAVCWAAVIGFAVMIAAVRG